MSQFVFPAKLSLRSSPQGAGSFCRRWSKSRSWFSNELGGLIEMSISWVRISDQDDPNNRFHGEMSLGGAGTKRVQAFFTAGRLKAFTQLMHTENPQEGHTAPVPIVTPGGLGGGLGGSVLLWALWEMLDDLRGSLGAIKLVISIISCSPSQQDEESCLKSFSKPRSQLWVELELRPKAFEPFPPVNVKKAGLMGWMNCVAHKRYVKV